MGDQQQTRRTVLGSALLATAAFGTKAVAQSAPARGSGTESHVPIQDWVKRLQAYEEIHNSVSRIAVAVNWHKPDEVLNQLALDKPDVSIEYADEGVFRGAQAIKTVVEAALQPLKVGEMLEIHIATPCIEVARDLKSARVLFGAPGYGALPEPQADGLPKATWNWGSLAADYIPYPDGSWKMLHGHYFRFIECSYQGGFVEDGSMVNRSHPLHSLAAPTTYHHPYSPLTKRESIPAVPRPYDTYNGNGWMLGKA